ncbi:MAG: signal peptidase I [Bacteroides sp.]|nr:signal peptidase I [Bacteroides sp.]MCM1550861.1 signal peptidase I [Clostridium sp.]
MKKRSGRRAYLRANRNRIRSSQRKKEINKRELLRTLGSYAVSILIVMIIGYSIVAFGGQTLRIVGQSMEPNLQNGDLVLVNKLVYIFREPERFELIAFKQRKGDNSYYNVKRVIGLPGETVTIQDGYIFIDGVALSGVPFDEKIATEGLALEGVTLGDGEYFVLGDNVNNSEDSRFANMGNILKNEILGRVVYRWLPKKTRGKL